MKERNHLDVFVVQSVPWCSFVCPLGWFQQAGVLALLGTLQQFWGRCWEGAAPGAIPPAGLYGDSVTVCTSSRSQLSGGVV